MKQLFLAQTPRLILLQAGIAATQRDRENHLCIVEHFSSPIAERYLKLIRDWPGSPFASVTLLPHCYRSRIDPKLTGYARHRAKRRVIHGLRRTARERIDALVEAHRPERVYVGSDEGYEAQYALHRAQEAREDSVGVYVEDGTAAYAVSFKRPLFENLGFFALKNQMRRVRLGHWWEHIRIPGTSRRISECAVAFPDLVLGELRDKKLVAMDVEIFRSEEMIDLARRIGHEFDLDIERMARCSMLVALSRSTLLPFLTGYEDTMRGLIECALEAGRGVGLKYHPRENRPDYLALGDRPGLYSLPSDISFEVLAILLPPCDAIVVGDVSTALLATRWLRPDVQVLAIEHPGESFAAEGYLHREFKELGIPIERDPEAVLARAHPECERTLAASGMVEPV